MAARNRAVASAPHLLAISCATRGAAVALLRGERIVVERESDGAGRRNQALLPLIEAVLDAAETSPSDLDAFAVTIGPGSFTGLRVGLSTLKGLAFGSNRPLAALSTLEALAFERLSDPGEVVMPLLDARRGEVYAAAYRLAAESERELEPVLVEAVYRPAELATQMPPRCRLVGEGVSLFGEELRGSSAAEVALETQGRPGPSAGALGILGQRCIARGHGVSLAGAVPRYVRRAEAEARRTGQRFEA